MLKNQLLCCWAIGFLLAGEVTVNLTPSSGGKWLNINQESLARSSGASSGGSGGSSGGRSSSSSSSSNSSRSSSSSSSTSSTSSTSSNNRSNSAASSSHSHPSNSGNTGGRVRSGSFDKPDAPAPVAAPNAPIPPQSSNHRTVIIQQRTYNSGPSYVIPYNSGNGQQNTGSNQQPAINPAPVTTDNNSGNSDTSLPSSDTPDNSQQNIGSEQQPAVNAPAPITTDNNSNSPPSSESDDDWKFVVFWLFVAGGCVALIAYCIYYYRQNPAKESKKHIFAVTKLQIVMLAEAREVPSQLTELTLNYDTTNASQRAEFLQESVLIVLRNLGNWTHVCANSQIVESREEATQIFNQISLQERSKLSVETLSMVNGDIRRRQSVSAGDAEPGEYIAVTFLIGTEDSRPLFGDIRDVAKLKAVLEKSAATPAENLLILEVLWSPQQETDSLTGDELLGSYPDLIRVG